MEHLISLPAWLAMSCPSVHVTPFVRIQLSMPKPFEKTMKFVGWFRFMLVLILPVAALAADKEEATYILRPNDVISVAVYEEADLCVQVRILKTGQASFPLIGPVQISGLTISAAAERLRELYAKDYLVDPKLNISVTDYATEFISVIGAVKSPGQIPMPVSGHIDLVTAMTSCGGLAETADANGIRLVRASGAISTYTMDAIQGASGRTQLAAGDRIIVNQSAFIGKTFAVLGQVSKPGPLPFPVKGKLDLVNAIAIAGGLTDLANPKKVSINRKGTVILVDFKAISQRGDRPFLIEPDDVITVAERLF
jgi:polysaccharide export outer membrane protein